jgi:hypothetical protein
MSGTLKVVLAAAAAVAVVVVACVTSQPQGSGGVASPGAVSPSRVVTPSPAVSASPAVTPSPTSGPSGAPSRMAVAGTELSGSPLPLTAKIPAGWVLEPYGAYPGTTGSLPPDGAGFFVSLVDDTFQDPCSHTSQRSPKIGSTVVAFATALGQIPHTTATKPVQTTIAGQAATYIVLTIPASLPCAPHDFYLWQDSPNGDWWVEGLNEVLRVWILDVGGQRVAIATRSWPGTSGAAKAELQGLLDSIVFDGASWQLPHGSIGGAIDQMCDWSGWHCVCVQK